MARVSTPVMAGYILSQTFFFYDLVQIFGGFDEQPKVRWRGMQRTTPSRAHHSLRLSTAVQCE